MPLLLTFLLRTLFLVAGVLFAAVLACALVLMLCAWALRAAWGLLTGQPVTPFVMRMGPRSGFEEMMRRGRAQQASRTPRADAAAGVPRRVTDVTDVDPK